MRNLEIMGNLSVVVKNAERIVNEALSIAPSRQGAAVKVGGYIVAPTPALAVTWAAQVLFGDWLVPKIVMAGATAPLAQHLRAPDDSHAVVVVLDGHRVALVIDWRAVIVDGPHPQQAVIDERNFEGIEQSPAADYADPLGIVAHLVVVEQLQIPE